VSAIQVSRAVRTNVEARFGALFNDALTSALTEFGVPELQWAINWDQQEDRPENFYRGDRTIGELVAKEMPALPALAMWTGEIADLSREKPRVFSGFVSVYWRFFLFVPGLHSSGLVEQRGAVEAAMVACLAAQPGAIGYRGDLASTPLAEQQLFSQDDENFGWVQEVTYTATFEVSV
jgi:hypothetical protein